MKTKKYMKIRRFCSQWFLLVISAWQENCRFSRIGSCSGPRDKQESNEDIFPLFLAFENPINITEAKTTNETVTEKQFMTTFLK